MLLENCLLLRADNVHGQITNHIFVPSGSYFLCNNDLNIIVFFDLQYPFHSGLPRFHYFNEIISSRFSVVFLETELNKLLIKVKKSTLFNEGNT